MAKKIFGLTVDFNKNELIKVRFENLLTFPTLTGSDVGYIFWHTVNKKPYGWDGTVWVDLAQAGTGGGGATNTITDYRSAYESSDNKVYDGYLLNGVITITREKDSTIEFAQSLTNLETDWINRLNLTYI